MSEPKKTRRIRTGSDMAFTVEFAFPTSDFSKVHGPQGLMLKIHEALAGDETTDRPSGYIFALADRWKDGRVMYLFREKDREEVVERFEAIGIKVEDYTDSPRRQLLDEIARMREALERISRCTRDTAIVNEALGALPKKPESTRVDSLEIPRIKECVYVVSATSYEYHSLWLQHSNEAATCGWGEGGEDWSGRECSMWTVQAGELAGFPVNMTLRFDTINGALVLFYTGCSRVVDSELLDEWLKEHVPAYEEGHRTDATNFNHCLRHIARS